ncbi:MAG: PDZ domain-containing protein, partial [Pseudomonas sp.]
MDPLAADAIVRADRLAGGKDEKTMRHGSLLLLMVLLTGCISSEPARLVPSITLSPESVSLSNGEPAATGLDFGMSTSLNESDSLSNITVLPGVRVRSVVPNGAADLAGIRTGDIILNIDGREINQPDLLDAIAQQTGAAGSFRFEVRRNTTVFETTVNPQATDSRRVVPVELYRADPIAIRAGFTTEVYEADANQARSGARVVTLFAESPLPGADIHIGDTIIAVDGEPVETAQGLITHIHSRYQPGERVRVTVVRSTAEGMQVSDRSLQLWDPGRRISRVSLWPLLRYE